MVRSVTNRRRWIFTAVTAVAAFVFLSIWWNYRPLNETERKLVGTWNVPSTMMDPGNAELTLNADRTYSFTELPKSNFFGIESGIWTADDDYVFLRYQPSDSDVWERLMFHARNIWKTGPRAPQYTICWDIRSGKRVPVRLSDIGYEARMQDAIHMFMLRESSDE